MHITYRPGTQNAAADALSRKTETLKTQKEKAEALRRLAIFQKHPDQEAWAPTLSGIQASPLDHERVAPAHPTNSDLALLEDEQDPPYLTGAVLVDKVLEENRKDPTLTPWRDKAGNPGEKNFTLANEKLLLC